VNGNKSKAISKCGEVVEKPHYKSMSEELMHVAARYHGTLRPKFTKFGNKFPPNFVCERSLVEKFCSLEK